MSDVTRILERIDAGDPRAAEQLLPLVYYELKKLAAAKLYHEKPGQTLQATALVHEAYLRLISRPDGEKERRREGETNEDQDRSVPPSLPPSVIAYNSRGHFFAAAAEAMRRILIERARGKARHKRGGDMVRVDLDQIDVADETQGSDLLELDDALTRLAGKHPEKAELVKLRYFAGLTGDEAAAALGISPATADRYWKFARAWLVRELSPEPNSGP
jgi:RNA polymerase sigma factor (sigma-70 family)